MNKAQFIFLAFSISAIVGVYSILRSYQDLVAAEDQVISAQKDLDMAVQNEAAAQDRLDNLKKYGCANPSVSPGGVMCP